MTTRFAQIVMGPAGSGKSTYIRHVLDHFEVSRRTGFAVNLDPAADQLNYTPVIDVREAVNVKEAMEEHGFGPNGGLIFCMEQIVTEFDWFDDEVGDHDYDYLLFDLPGQIEIFSHLDILPRLFSHLQRKGYNLCGVFLMDSQFMCDPSKFLSGCLVALSAMMILEIPHVNILSKCDLLSDDQREQLESFCQADTMVLAGPLMANTKTGPLTAKVCELIDKYNMLDFTPLDIEDTMELAEVVSRIDVVLQYYDNADYGDPEFSMAAEDPNDKHDSD
jgi:GTPase SAR1 family protein